MSAIANKTFVVSTVDGVLPTAAEWLNNFSEASAKAAAFFDRCAEGFAPGNPGETSIALIEGSTAAVVARAYATIALVSCAANTVVEINGAPFSAISGAANAGNDEFDMSGTDAADATSLAASVTASTTAAVQNVRAANIAATLTLASVAAGEWVEINGVRLTASASPIGIDQFSMAGTDTVDAASLAAVVNAHPQLTANMLATSAAGVVTLRRWTGTTALTIAKSAAGITTSGTAASGTITAATAIAGNTCSVGGITFTGVAGSTLTAVQFSIDTSDTAAGDSLRAQINLHPVLLQRVLATNVAGVVTITALDKGTAGNGITLTGTVTTLAASGALLTGGIDAFAAVSTVLISSKQRGALGNALTVKTLGVVGADACTCVSVIATDTLIINGQTFTAEQERATGTLTAASTVAGDVFTVGAAGSVVTFTGAAGAVTSPTAFSVDSTDTAQGTSIKNQINAHPTLSGVVTATSSAGVVTVRAVTAGTAGNSIVLTGTAVRLAASGSGTLAGGAAVANNKWDISPGGTNAQGATDLARAINASTTALVNQHVRALARSNVVLLMALAPSTNGNSINVTSTGGTISVATARLAGGTILSADGAQASCTLTLASVLNTQTVTINGVVYTAHTNTQANDQFDISGSDTADAAALALAINNSTTAGSADIIATSAAAVVTVKARRGGVQGNAITVAASDATVTIGGNAVSGKLGSGAVPTTVVVSGPRLTAGVGGDGTAVTRHF